jgi:D-alanyl-D-alanine carboxypeptidase
MKTTIPQPELATMHRELGIPSDYELRTKLPFFQEISLSRLVVAQLDDAGRPLVLSQETAKSWHSMQAAASAAGISLLPFSGFRSYRYQMGLIAAKLAKGISIEEVLRVLAAPGYSEHHTGEALDITTTGCPAAEEVFSQTSAYSWLSENAGNYGFKESFGPHNPHSLVYEPWHWKFHPGSVSYKA